MKKSYLLLLVHIYTLIISYMSPKINLRKLRLNSLNMHLNIIISNPNVVRRCHLMYPHTRIFKLNDFRQNINYRVNHTFFVQMICFLYQCLFVSVLPHLLRREEIQGHRILWGLHWVLEALWQNGEWNHDVGRAGTHPPVSW